MTTPARTRYAGDRFPAEIISHAVWLYFRFPLGLRMVEELLAARGIIVSHEMALIREAVEHCAPPASVAREGYLTPKFTVQAEALVRGIYAIAGRSRRTSRAQPSE